MSAVADTLSHLVDIVRLASFATEARRVLVELETLERIRPEKYGTLLDEITAHRQWTMMPETTSAVLDHVADQLQALAEELDKAEANQRMRSK